MVVTCDDNQFGPKPTEGERGEQVEGIENIKLHFRYSEPRFNKGTNVISLPF